MKHFFWSLLLLTSLYADAPARTPWSLQDTYTGSHQASYEKLRYEIPNLMRQTTLDMAVRCGLDFQDGWSVPLVVRFVEGSPDGVENVLAYVQLMEDANTHALVQTLNINLAAYESYGFDFNKVFAHELVHAMINDALKEKSLDLPTWFHEGLAVYGADQGEQLMRSTLSQYPNANEASFLNGLEGPHGPQDYLEDYLAFQYIHDNLGVSALQNFIRDVIQRGGDIKTAIDYTLHLSWDQFQSNVRAYSEEQLFAVGRNLRSRNVEKAY
jgi:hypothetical protein